MIVPPDFLSSMSSPMLLVRLLIFLALAQSSHTTLVDLRTASSAAKIILKRTKFEYVFTYLQDSSLRESEYFLLAMYVQNVAAEVVP